MLSLESNTTHPEVYILQATTMGGRGRENWYISQNGAENWATDHIFEISTENIQVLENLSKIIA
jgi:hypothetical protein